jgi:hypothetical protein
MELIGKLTLNKLKNVEYVNLIIQFKNLSECTTTNMASQRARMMPCFYAGGIILI